MTDLLLGVALLLVPAPPAEVPPPDEVRTEGVPPIPEALARVLQPYRSVPGYAFGGWLGGRREVLVRAGAAPSGQVFSVVTPGAPPHQLTHISGRVLGVEPRPGRNQFAMLYDVEGDEAVQIALFDTPSGRAVPLTDGRSRHAEPRWSPDGARLAFTGNARNGRDHDLYLLDPDEPRARPRLLAELQGLATVEDWSPDGGRVLVLEIDPDRGISVVAVDAETGEKSVLLPSPTTTGVHSPADPRWSPDGDVPLRQPLRRRRVPPPRPRRRSRPGELTVLTADVEADVESFAVLNGGETLAATIHDDGYSSLRLLDAATGRELGRPAVPAGQIFDLLPRPDGAEVGFTLEPPTGGAQAYSYIASNGAVVHWTHAIAGEPDFDPPAPPERFTYETFDGRTIPGFLYRPDPRRFPGPRPVLVELHGGPQAQARPGFLGPDAYLVTELGLAMVVPNVRGSTGYGISYMRLDDRRRREDAVRDVGALLDWIAERPELDGSRVAVRGGSYGGYLVLATLARCGDRVRAGIDVAGISSFETFMADQPPLRLELLRLEFGDERDPSTQAFFREISPLNRADRIETPLLVAQGQNDPRVPVAEARQIVDAVRANGVPVWYVLAGNEGHGFSRGENREFLRHVEARFLLQFLRDRGPAEQSSTPAGGGQQ